ncbi:MAG: hypothetical protein FWE31_02450 [Firmicutes bacterium]|nr:hypothetical protein [Bacillota bacterium]
MSFFQANVRDRPGPIRGDACVGLCHRVAVSAKRILDSALCKDNMENTTLLLENVPREVVPVTFVEAVSTTPTPLVSNLQVTRVRERPNFARVQCRLNIPLSVEFIDDVGVRHTVSSSCTANYDIILFVPRESIFPFEILAQCGVQSTVGTVDAVSLTANATICVTTSLKVIAETDLMIPAYGFAPTPPAISFSEDACRDFFELPLFPTSNNRRR